MWAGSLAKQQITLFLSVLATAIAKLAKIYYHHLSLRGMQMATLEPNFNTASHTLAWNDAPPTPPSAYSQGLTLSLPHLPNMIIIWHWLATESRTCWPIWRLISNPFLSFLAVSALKVVAGNLSHRNKNKPAGSRDHRLWDEIRTLEFSLAASREN